LQEIENLATVLQTLTHEKDQLTTDKSNLEAQLTEKDKMINNTTIPNLITQLGKYARAVTDSELKTQLTDLQTTLAGLRNTDLGDTNSKIEELKNQVEKLQKQKSFPSWAIYSLLGLGILGFFGILRLILRKNSSDSEPKTGELGWQ